MHDNIGSKIKDLTIIILIVELIPTVIIGVLLAEERFALGLLFLILGFIIELVSALLLYGFGEIIDKLADIEYNTRADKADNKDNNMYDNESELPQKKCPECGVSHDFDCPKCPNCNHKYENVM